MSQLWGGGPRGLDQQRSGGGRLLLRMRADRGAPGRTPAAGPAAWGRMAVARSPGSMSNADQGSWLKARDIGPSASPSALRVAADDGQRVRRDADGGAPVLRAYGPRSGGDGAAGEGQHDVGRERRSAPFRG